MDPKIKKALAMSAESRPRMKTPPDIQCFFWFCGITGTAILAFFMIALMTGPGGSPSSRPPKSAQGDAAWYGEELRGHPMANGLPFDPDALTAASWDYPLGAWVRVQHGSRSVWVVITDRGPAKRLVAQGRIIDLSEAAFSHLAPPDEGVIHVSIFPYHAN